MGQDHGDFRPPSEWDGHLRTVCHHCRGAGSTTVQDEDDTMRSRPVVIAGDGEIVKSVATVSGMDGLVTVPCPVCGELPEPGWLPGFVVPV
jgi:hypothetical protein